MERAAQQLTDPHDAEVASRWISWAKTYTDDLDPLNRRLATPEAPEPTAEALKPFLDGWSPHGPGGFSSGLY